jgi:hypothetical protein
MKKRLVIIKFVALLVCTLLVATAVPAVESQNHKTITATVSGTSQSCTRADWNEIQKLLAPDGATGDAFGLSVFLSGDTALIGAPCNDDNTGSAYVFTRTGTTWTQQAKLLASDGEAGDGFGFSVSLDGDTALIGAPLNNGSGVLDSGSAYVFTRTGTTWTQQTKLLASDQAEMDLFGYSVSLGGDTALIGAYWDDDNGADSGSAYVFMRENGTPDLEIDITGGLGVNAVITNNGTANASGVNWQINIEGGILGRINKTMNGTIDIPMGEARTVSTGLFLGLGPFTIIARAADKEKTATGFVFLFLVLGVK